MRYTSFSKFEEDLKNSLTKDEDIKLWIDATMPYSGHVSVCWSEIQKKGLFAAIDANRSQIVAHLLKKRYCSPHSVRDEHTPAQKAALEGKWDCVTKIAEYVKSDSSWYQNAGDRCRLGSALFLAVRAEQPFVFIEKLCKAGAPIYWHEPASKTGVLHYAAEKDATNTMVVLLKHPQVNQELFKKTTEGKTPIEIAAEKGHWYCVRLIAQHIVANKNSINLTADNKAALGKVLDAPSTTRQSASLLTLLIQAKLNPADTRHPIEAAAADGRWEIVKLLTNQLKQPTPQDFQAIEKAFLLALRCQRPDICKSLRLSGFKHSNQVRPDDMFLLIEQGVIEKTINGSLKEILTTVNVNQYIEVTDKQGNTPLHSAVALNNTEAVKLLLEHGASTSKENDARESSMQLAKLGSFTIRDLFDSHEHYRKKFSEAIKIDNEDKLVNSIALFKQKSYDIARSRIVKDVLTAVINALPKTKGSFLVEPKPILDAQAKILIKNILRLLAREFISLNADLIKILESVKEDIFGQIELLGNNDQLLLKEQLFKDGKLQDHPLRKLIESWQLRNWAKSLYGTATRDSINIPQSTHHQPSAPPTWQVPTGHVYGAMPSVYPATTVTTTTTSAPPMVSSSSVTTDTGETATGMPTPLYPSLADASTSTSTTSTASEITPTALPSSDSVTQSTADSSSTTDAGSGDIAPSQLPGNNSLYADWQAMHEAEQYFRHGLKILQQQFMKEGTVTMAVPNEVTIEAHNRGFAIHTLIETAAQATDQLISFLQMAQHQFAQQAPLIPIPQPFLELSHVDGGNNSLPACSPAQSAGDSCQQAVVDSSDELPCWKGQTPSGSPGTVASQIGWMRSPSPQSNIGGTATLGNPLSLNGLR
jgi:ankyrin repeat protein